jgi:nicotinate-nucleotide adenylyltransferase
MRIGFFGGSFDPPHRGHIALARLAMERLALDRVIFAPVGIQPLKRDRAQASFTDRVTMTDLAIQREPGLELSLIDAPRSDGRPNYTIDAIRALQSTLTRADQLFFLMGADSFLSIARWYRANDLLLTCDFVVAARPGFDLSRLAAALPASISVAAATGDPHPGNLVLRLRGAARRESRLYLLPDLDEIASASRIRAALPRGAGIQTLLDPAVAAFIHQHRLYQDGHDS